jgi:DNA-binding NarL/FixJ family response regulator
MPRGSHRRVQGEQPITVERRRPITVVLVDEEPLIREALAGALGRAGIALVGEAQSAEEAVALVVDQRPDVVLIDIKLRRSRGIQVIERIAALAAGSQLLVLTRLEQNQVVEAIIAGASGYILKTSPAAEIVEAVRVTAAGEAVLSPKIAGKLLERIRERDLPITASGGGGAADAIRAVLTVREFEVLSRLPSGEDNRRIGEALGLSLNTVRNHVASILKKLQLDNRIQAAAQAIRSGIA